MSFSSVSGEGVLSWHVNNNQKKEIKIKKTQNNTFRMCIYLGVKGDTITLSSFQVNDNMEKANDDDFVEEKGKEVTYIHNKHTM